MCMAEGNVDRGEGDVDCAGCQLRRSSRIAASLYTSPGGVSPSSGVIIKRLSRPADWNAGAISGVPAPCGRECIRGHG